ncbi:hypothetical protein PPACK8108_LOCUS20368 [Phakopsora pachyrhizi]|uniref:Protoporphyrinogen oxidase n=1 Tax=Phakopsora pachyrhizi TaxID=170000 RepID=A0AAV0BGQ7_PHAPC|nr:hypothetical protein PPACK8108_LOCUS20368 [Phakopsora pachyrhizi]
MRVTTALRRQRNDLVVLGGGLSGLTTAYYLSRSLKDLSRTGGEGGEISGGTRIYLLEKTDRFGGWINSNRIITSHSDHGSRGRSLVFESGPRSLRSNGLAGLTTLELADRIGLREAMIVIPKDHPSAKNRYIYSGAGLRRLPSSLADLVLTTFKQPTPKILQSLLRDMTRARDDFEIEDESIKSFLERRFGGWIGEELVSGLVHGIYAGDYGQLSAKSTIFGPIWNLERRHGGVIRGLMSNHDDNNNRNSQRALEQEQELKRLKMAIEPGLQNCSVWGLRGGLESLVKSLRNHLSREDNVVLMGHQEVTSILRNDQSSYNIVTNSETFGPFQHVFSCLAPRVLKACLPPDFKETFVDLSHNPSVTVAVVNLAYDCPNRRRVNPLGNSFGYLLPASVGLDLNPHRALGVVFDSDMMPGIDNRGTAPGNGSDGGVEKMTVMLGGHHYHPEGNCEVPGSDQLVYQAIKTVRLQLGIEQEPFYAHAHLQKDCIAQYLVGHHRRMSNLHQGLSGKNLSVLGAGFGGVGVNDVVLGCKEVVENFARGRSCTGLEKFCN